jgi:hypothetical protein
LAVVVVEVVAAPAPALVALAVVVEQCKNVLFSYLLAPRLL